jgi:hypothetical protein
MLFWLQLPQEYTIGLIQHARRYRYFQISLQICCVYVCMYIKYFTHAFNLNLNNVYPSFIVFSYSI